MKIFLELEYHHCKVERISFGTFNITQVVIYFVLVQF